MSSEAGKTEFKDATGKPVWVSKELLKSKYADIQWLQNHIATRPLDSNNANIQYLLPLPEKPSRGVRDETNRPTQSPINTGEDDLPDQIERIIWITKWQREERNMENEKVGKGTTGNQNTSHWHRET